MAPGDAQVFAEATTQLQANESHTVEVAFRLRIERTVAIPSGDDQDPDESQRMPLYQEMDGKGMLMNDRQSGMPSHTMWVFKPVRSPEPEADLQDDAVKAPGGDAAVGPVAAISVQPLLCRICERDVPTWFFEKHSEICNEIHRLEMEIGECNESLAELRRTTKAINSRLEDPQSSSNPEYRGAVLSTPPASSNPPSALEALNRSLTPRHPNPASLRKLHLRALDNLVEVLQTAFEIATPAVKEDAVGEPIEKQRLLSPTSEQRVLQVHAWRKPERLDDAALELLSADVEAAMRSKLSAVNRTLNTIVYVETLRLEWEERVETALAAANGEEETESEGSGSEEGLESGEGSEKVDNSGEVEEEEEEVLEGETSGLLLERDDRDEIARPHSAGLSQADEDDIPAVDADMGGSNTDHSPIPIPRGHAATAHPVAHQEGSSLSRQASTKSRRHSHLPTSVLEKSLLQTPPLSPYNIGSDAQTGGSSASSQKHRRASMSVRSPHTGPMPLSPRLPPMAPSSRATASSIKDFDIIKPISKGAFGSVFLAKKRATGDYYAIKVLKKSDMIAKNQITNVKAERMILMTQTQSPFVVKLFFTFQSQDYLYLVMEYLPGGDCASLCKTLGGLTEDWTKYYIAEVVHGLEQLHQKGVVHR